MASNIFYLTEFLFTIVWVGFNSILRNGLRRIRSPTGSLRYVIEALSRFRAHPDRQRQFLVNQCLWNFLAVKCCLEIPDIPTETLRNQCRAVTKTVTKNYRYASNKLPAFLIELHSRSYRLTLGNTLLRQFRFHRIIMKHPRARWYECQ